MWHCCRCRNCTSTLSARFVIFVVVGGGGVATAIVTTASVAAVFIVRALIGQCSLSPHQKTKGSAGQSHVQIAEGGTVENARRVHRQCVLEHVVSVTDRGGAALVSPARIGSIVVVVVVVVAAGVFVVAQLSRIEKFQVARAPYTTNATTNVGWTSVSDFGRN